MVQIQMKRTCCLSRTESKELGSRDNCQDKQETDQKALIRKSLGKGIYDGMRVFKISCLSQGVEKTMHMPKTGYMFRKGLILTKDPKSSPLAGLQALCRQEVKVKAGL